MGHSTVRDDSSQSQAGTAYHNLENQIQRTYGILARFLPQLLVISLTRSRLQTRHAENYITYLQPFSSSCRPTVLSLPRNSTAEDFFGHLD